MVSTAEQQPEHLCIIKVILILNSKHSPVPVIQKKKNSIAAKTRTIYGAGLKTWYLIAPVSGDLEEQDV